VANTTPIARSQISIDGPAAVVDGWEISTRTSSAALTLRDESHLTKVVVRSTDGAPVSAQLPANGSARHAGDTIQIGSAPSEWYLMAKGATTASLVSGLDLPGASGYAAWTDVTHGRALVRLTGADSAKMLSKLCAINLADKVTPNGRAFRTSIAGVNTDIIRDDTNAGRSYLLHCERSSGQYLFDALLDAGIEFGIEPVGAGA